MSMWNKEELTRQYRTMTLREIASMRGVSHESVRQAMINLELERRNRGRQKKYQTLIDARDYTRRYFETHQDQRETWLRRLLDKLLRR